MKKLLMILAIAAVCQSCCKVGGDFQVATVIKDCTGSYLRINDKDFHVCNTGKLRNFNDSDVVRAVFKRISNCKSESDRIVCAMLHENEGWIEISEVKR